MSTRRVFITLAVSAGLIVAVTLPAQAASDQTKKKSVSAPSGRSGSVTWSAKRSGTISNSVTMTATDPDGPGGRCTETWVDYSTKPHEHFNPALLVNCSGGTRSVSGALANNSKNVSGAGIVVCDVPNTSGPISRNSSNCRGDFSVVWVRSGQRYDSFKVNAAQHPEGVRITKF